MAGTLTCETCGGEFPRAATGKPARWCSGPCYRRSEEYRSYRRDLARRKYVPKERARLPEAERKRRRREVVRRYNASPKGRARWARWYAENGWNGQPPVPYEPMPMPYVGHEVFAEAAKAARLGQSVAYGVDWGQNDIMGEAVLAILEGRDPDEAVRKHRAHEKGLTAMRAYVHDVGWDGHRVVVQRYGPEDHDR